MTEGKYDVVVIGGGMGGMCAGALAVKEGYRTLVAEKREHIGGRFSTQEVEGFKLMTGAPFIHVSGWVPKVCKEVGIGFGGNLLFGDPAETEDTIHETLDFWAKYCQQSLVFLAMVIPYPGCKIFEDAFRIKKCF